MSCGSQILGINLRTSINLFIIEDLFGVGSLFFFFWSLKQCFISIFGILVCDLCVFFISVTNKKTHQSHIKKPIIHTNIHARCGSKIFQRDKRTMKINKTLTQKYQNFYELEIRWY